MKYEKFWEISKFMRAVTINSEFSLPGLMMRSGFALLGPGLATPLHLHLKISEKRYVFF